MPTTTTTSPGPYVWPCPAGFAGWERVGMREYERANRDGLPTQRIEYNGDDHFRVQYWVARYLPGPGR